MKGKLRDLTLNRDGTQNVTVTVSTDFRQTYEVLKDVEVDIDIKKHRERRSRDANAYAWVLIDKIAAAMSIDKEQVYKEAIRSVGGVSETVCVVEAAADRLRKTWERNGIGWQTETMPSKIPGCTNVVLYYGSSVYDTKQMSTLIDHLVQDAKALGIETMTPRELQSLMEGWC